MGVTPDPDESPAHESDHHNKCPPPAGVDGRVVRRHGFHPPFDPLQMLSWVITTLLVTSFYMLLAPMLSTPWNIIAMVVYFVLLLGVLALGYETGRTDPIDPYVLCSEEELAGIPGLLKCAACCSRVNHLSRHCLICDKCVVDFDHHCKWLNNCIGAENYRSFRWLIASTALLISTQLAVSVTLCIRYFIDWDQLSVDVRAFYLDIDENLYFTLVCANVVLGIPSLCLVMHLVGFHIYLSSKGLTTYNYVMNIEAEANKSNAYLDESSEGEEESEEDEEEEEEEGGEDQLSSCLKPREEERGDITADPAAAAGGNAGESAEGKTPQPYENGTARPGTAPRRLEPLSATKEAEAGPLPGAVSN